MYYKASNSIKLYLLQIFCITHLILNLMEKETEIEAKKKKTKSKQNKYRKNKRKHKLFLPPYFASF